MVICAFFFFFLLMYGICFLLTSPLADFEI